MTLPISLRLNVVHVNGLPLFQYSNSCRFLRKISLFLFAFLFLGMSQGLAENFGVPFIDISGSDTEETKYKIEAEHSITAVVDTVVTVRCANPQFNCATETYCVDVEFKTNTANIELFGMNVRFFYDDLIFEFINFTGFLGGYGVTQPTPPLITYQATFGPNALGFGGGSDYVNGAIQKNNLNATPIIISTVGWTKLYQICFDVETAYLDVSNFCPPIVWDLEANPANGGYPPGSDGVVMTVIVNGTSKPAKEAVNQFNWQYVGNGPPPYGAPIETYCNSTVCGTCNLIVSTNNDFGENSLRSAIQCAESGDTVTFASNMAGLTINLDTSRILINKNLYIRSNLVANRVKITSTTLPGLFEIAAGKTVEFKDLDITSGLTIAGNDGAAFKNQGNLRLLGVKVFKNVSLPAGQYLIRNKPGSQLTLLGNCFVEIP